MLGLSDDIVKLIPYTPDWAHSFEAESLRLQGVLGSQIVDVEHIGSTAIPNLVAKPIIDMSVGVYDFDSAKTCIPKLEAAGYTYLGENGIPRRHYFKLGLPNVTHHLHMVEIHSLDRMQTVLFRDYLREHPEIAQAYATLKIRLAEQYPYDRPSYLKGKGPFIQQVIARAKAEQNKVTSQLI